MPDIENLLTNNSEPEIIINYYVNETEGKVNIEYNDDKPISFTNKFTRIEKNGYERNNDGTLKPSRVIEFALHKFREYLEEKFEYDWVKWHDEYEDTQ